jgi:hypothetical protein
MRIFDPDGEDFGYNPYEFIPVDDEPKLKLKDIGNIIIELFHFACYFTGALVIGWNLGKLLKWTTI